MEIVKRGMPKSHIIWNERHPNDRVKKGEVIHHKNGNHDDDREENQEKMLWGEHSTLHNKVIKLGNTYRKGKKHSKKTRELMMVVMKGNSGTIGNKSRTGLKHTDIAKDKMSLAAKGNKSMTGRKHTEETKQKMRDLYRRRIENANC